MCICATLILAVFNLAIWCSIAKSLLKFNVSPIIFLHLWQLFPLSSPFSHLLHHVSHLLSLCLLSSQSLPPSPPHYLRYQGQTQSSLSLHFQTTTRTIGWMHGALMAGYKDSYETRWWVSWELLRRLLLVSVTVALPGRTVCPQMVHFYFINLIIGLTKAFRLEVTP